jgi:hypothetical protein
VARLPVLRGSSCGKFPEHRRAASSALTAAASVVSAPAPSFSSWQKNPWRSVSVSHSPKRSLPDRQRLVDVVDVG